MNRLLEEWSVSRNINNNICINNYIHPKYRQNNYYVSIHILKLKNYSGKTTNDLYTLIHNIFDIYIMPLIIINLFSSTCHCLCIKLYNQHDYIKNNNNRTLVKYIFLILNLSLFFCDIIKHIFLGHTVLKPRIYLSVISTYSAQITYKL